MLDSKLLEIRVRLTHADKVDGKTSDACGCERSADLVVDWRECESEGPSEMLAVSPVQSNISHHILTRVKLGEQHPV